MRASIRLAALMQAPSMFVFTHDSIGVGEDGPTHQPIEQLASLRAMPEPDQFCGRETRMRSSKPGRSLPRLRHSPAALVLTRQNLPTLDRSKYASASGSRQRSICARGCTRWKARCDSPRHGKRTVALCGCLREALKTEGINARVVSMPVTGRFSLKCSKTMRTRRASFLRM